MASLASLLLWAERFWEAEDLKVTNSQLEEHNIIPWDLTTGDRTSTPAAATTTRGWASTRTTAVSAPSAQAISTPRGTAGAATTAGLAAGTITLTTSILYNQINKIHNNKTILTTQDIPLSMDRITIS